MVHHLLLIIWLLLAAVGVGERHTLLHLLAAAVQEAIGQAQVYLLLLALVTPLLLVVVVLVGQPELAK